MYVSSTLKSAKKKRKSKKTKPSPLETKYPSLHDSFQRQEMEQEQRHMMAEFGAKMEAQEALHKQRIANIFSLLHTQLYQMWNEMWMQRQKAWDDSFKAWKKLISS